MASKPVIPYYAPPHILPAPLPSIPHILATAYTAPDLSDPGLIQCRIIRVGEHFTVKFGTKVHLQEGENMLFVQQSTRVRVPTVYALLDDREHTGYNFIIQEYIPGRSIYDSWDSLTVAMKDLVASQLQFYFRELRALPSPGYFGGLWRQPIREMHLAGATDSCEISDSLITQPHESGEHWIDAMLHAAQARFPLNRPRLRWVKRMYHCALRNHKPVFTHGDLHPCKILIRDQTVVLTSWEHSGWYPDYWEYCFAVAISDWKGSDWVDWIPRFLEEYPNEMGWAIHFHQWIVMGSSD